ncbi:MAG: RNA 3'-terminal phosphate cyclase [Fimbriimonadaceae bacterium]
MRYWDGVCGGGINGGKPQAFVDTIWGEFLDWWSSDTAVDPFLADQLLVPAVLADGKTHFSTQKVTRRLVTMAWIIKQFIPIQVTIKGREGTKGSVTIQR